MSSSKPPSPLLVHLAVFASLPPKVLELKSTVSELQIVDLTAIGLAIAINSLVIVRLVFTILSQPFAAALGRTSVIVCVPIVVYVIPFIVAVPILSKF